jgi:clan AA aspartic protease (TIGR02281 family)
MDAHIEREGQVEPHLDHDQPLGNIGFLKRDIPIRASRSLRTAAYVLVSLYVGFSFLRAVLNGAGAPILTGLLLGCGLAVMLPVWVSMWWEERKNSRRRHLVAAITAACLLALELVGFLSVRGTFQHVAGSKPMTPQQIADQALRCQSNGDLQCAAAAWQSYLEQRPTDLRARVTLGMVKNRQGDDPGAIVEFEKAIAAGAGAYDLFAYYARSLARVGRTREAIEWSYSALSAAPMLMDVRASLATLLVAEDRRYEALALLQDFDRRLEPQGQPARFTAQRTAIEDGIRKAHAAPAAAAAPALRLASLGGHFHVPVSVGWARPVLFMVDTGATLASLSTKMLSDSGVRYEVLDANATMVTADSRKVPARVVLLQRIQVGPHSLRNVRALVCESCASLLGNSALSSFDMQSFKIRGVEYLSLVPRS